MKLKLWGTRGSLPRSINQETFIELVDQLARRAETQGSKSITEFRMALRDGKLGDPMIFGGNTTCSEIIAPGHRFYVDMGTGITDAAVEAMSEGRTEFTVFQTHLHWDHVMGLPFFVPIYIPGNKIVIYHVHANAPEHIRIQFNGVNFPVRWEQLGATVEFRQLKLYETVRFGDTTVSPFALDHPGGSFGYRFESGGKALAIGVDGEYKRTTPKELGKDLPYYQNLDLLLFDGQYEMDELASRFDWGHCSPPIGIDLALREGIRTLVMTHHDPRSGEEKEFKMHQDALEHLKSQLPAYQKIWDKLEQPEGPKVVMAYDGMTIDMDKL